MTDNLSDGLNNDLCIDSNNDFLAKCRSINPSAEIDRNKNLETIKEALKIRLLQEEEQLAMLRNRRIKRPAIATALVAAATMMLSVAAYAAVPTIWRYFDTRVVTGEEFVNSFAIGEFDLPDGTTSTGGGIDIDRAALEAAGGGVVIVEVEGEEMIALDELHFDNLDEGLALLKLDNVLIPRDLPEGFAFSRLTFPVNPIYHQYAWGHLPTGENAHVFFSNNEGDVIQMMIAAMCDFHSLAVACDQQGLVINDKSAVLSGIPLSDEQLAAMEGVTIFDGYLFEERPRSVMATRNDGKPHLVVEYNGIVYSFSAESHNVTPWDLVRMAMSMR